MNVEAMVIAQLCSLPLKLTLQQLEIKQYAHSLKPVSTPTFLLSPRLNDSTVHSKKSFTNSSRWVKMEDAADRFLLSFPYAYCHSSICADLVGILISRRSKSDDRGRSDYSGQLLPMQDTHNVFDTSRVDAEYRPVFVHSIISQLPRAHHRWNVRNCQWAMRQLSPERRKIIDKRKGPAYASVCSPTRAHSASVWLS